MRVLVVIGMLGACYAPKVQPGSPCVDSPCPSELVCSPATMTCEYAATDAAVHDAPVVLDDATDAPGSACFGTGIVRVCLLHAPMQALQISSNTVIDTDASPQCLPSDTPSLCVIGGASVTIAAVLSAHGSRPLVVVSSGGIAISGGIDVSSRIAGHTIGAAADPSSCVGGGGAVTRGGGAGGSFGGVGGAGGQAGGATALAGPATTLTSLRGGCAGSDGAGDTVGRGSPGGGAIAVLADGALNITGHVLANGAGGSAAALQGGGGGAGAGGAIVLDAASLTLGGGASVFANGGGGGEGQGTGNTAMDGADPALATVAAPGGAGGATNGGDGGNGSVGDMLDGGAGGAATSDTAGGGGGGGGAGIIRVFRASIPSSGVFSPHPS